MGSYLRAELGYIELSRKILQQAYQNKLAINSKFPSPLKIGAAFDVSIEVIDLAFKELIRQDYCYSLNGCDMHLKKSPEKFSRSCLTYGLVLGYPRLDEKKLSFYRNLYLSAERKIIEEDGNLLCLQDWAKKSIVRKKQELAQFTPYVSGYLGIGLFQEKDCLLLRASGVSSVVVDLDASAYGLDSVVFNNVSIMEKLVEAVLSKTPEAVYYADFDRTCDYDPAVEERLNTFCQRYSKHLKGKNVFLSSVLSVQWGGLKELKPLLDHMKRAIGPIYLICADDSVALNISNVLEEVGIVAGKDFGLAYMGAAGPRPELRKYEAIIGVLPEEELCEVGFDLLKGRIQKGAGQATVQRISGNISRWSPNKNVV